MAKLFIREKGQKKFIIPCHDSISTENHDFAVYLNSVLLSPHLYYLENTTAKDSDNFNDLSLTMTDKFTIELEPHLDCLWIVCI